MNEQLPISPEKQITHGISDGTPPPMPSWLARAILKEQAYRRTITKGAYGKPQRKKDKVAARVRKARKARGGTRRDVARAILKGKNIK